MKIVVLDGHAANPGDLSWDGLKAFGDLTVYPRTPQDKVVERLKDTEIALTNKVSFTRDIIAQLPSLKYIGVNATGYNLIDLDATRERGIVVTNVPAYSTDSVVQSTFAHLFNISNQVAHYAQSAREAKWSNNPDFCFWDTPLHELSGKVMGIVGLGNIGMKVAQIAMSFGMDVFAVTSKHSHSLPEGIQKTTLDGLLSASDVISLHIPLMPETFHLINDETLSKMHPGTILINTARGSLVDEAAVARALNSGILTGYGADVMEQEPPKADNPLFACPNAYITPHIAWATEEARKRLINTVVENVRAFCEGRELNRVG